MQLRFSGMAHIVRSKHSIDRYIAKEINYARRYNPDEKVGQWRQEFPFDTRCDETVLLWAQDLQDAGDTSKWDFKTAYHYANNLQQGSQTEQDNRHENGGRLLIGKTRSNARASRYYHTPESV